MSLACTLNGPLQLSVERDVAAGPSLGEVRLRLGAGGICGSDLHCYQHGRAGAFAIRSGQKVAVCPRTHLQIVSRANPDRHSSLVDSADAGAHRHSPHTSHCALLAAENGLDQITTHAPP